MITSNLERNIADIQRWGIVRTIRKQSVAEHMYFVALWIPRALRMVGIDRQDWILAAMEYALTHDMPEVLSGDIPTPIRVYVDKGMINLAAREYGVAPTHIALPEPILDMVKILDLFEACMFLAEEMAMGNLRVREILAVVDAKLHRAIDEYNGRHVEFDSTSKLKQALVRAMKGALEGNASPLEGLGDKMEMPF